ncbi:sigma factor SigF [Synechococcus sp. RSCCF101]|uniref:sigma factor SigF n=1 Tax=Synechococcus sp. RSCCF101 TaxID=2511069 RepID=UPI001246D795|nr:sigma factor SigF [Synechococcus sp. RSCCF101]QEY31735.1 sigma factor SigF [Synechococcus sp. RSCCF101]
MLPPFTCCSGSGDHLDARRRHQQRKLSMLQFWRDGLERQLAALDGAISALQSQIDRDAAAPSEQAPQS